MAYRILTAAALAVALAAPAFADPVSQSQSRCEWHKGNLYCRSRLITPNSTINTYCGYGRRNSVCETESERPVQPIVRNANGTGVTVMRGTPSD